MHISVTVVGGGSQSNRCVHLSGYDYQKNQRSGASRIHYATTRSFPHSPFGNTQFDTKFQKMSRSFRNFEY